MRVKLNERFLSIYNSWLQSLTEKEKQAYIDIVSNDLGFNEIMEKRVFTQGRKEQGFKSQEHLDAFHRYYDHTKACAKCQKPGPGVELDDGIQPTLNRCVVAQDLYRLYAERRE